MNHEQAVSSLASERYLLDEMSEPERSTFEEHYFSCAVCAEDVRLSALMREGAAVGAQVLRPRFAWRSAVVLPWAAAAALAIVVGYQSLVVVPELRRLGEPQALAPVTLRPASRGEAPLVSVGPQTGIVTLAVDLGAAGPGGELEFSLRAESGMIVAAGKAPAPPPGAPLLLLLPARVVSVPGPYVLSISNPARGDGTSDEYRFQVTVQ
jgi:hypothetical protein